MNCAGASVNFIPIFQALSISTPKTVHWKRIPNFFLVFQKICKILFYVNTAQQFKLCGAIRTLESTIVICCEVEESGEEKEMRDEVGGGTPGYSDLFT